MSQILNEMVSGVRSKSPDVRALLDMRSKVFGEKDAIDAVTKSSNEWNGSREAQGMFLYLIGRHERAIRVLEQEAASDAGKLFLGLAALEEGFPEKALEPLKGLKELPAKVARARALMLSGNYDEADKATAALEKSDGKEVDVRLLRAELQFRTGQLEDAFRNVSELHTERPDLDNVQFIAALIFDRCGDEDASLECFERLAQRRPTHVAALMNLGIIYEDEAEFEAAARCYSAVLRDYPDHQRAKLYLKDARASLDMYYDEERERKEDKRMQVLRTPISDFELSVRSRNCLQKMSIETLGDLIQQTEPELLAYKNFGETSLQEIKAILSSRGLRLGMGRDEALKATSIDEALEKARPKHEGIMAESIDTLELSVRARKCMERLHVSTIGQLCEHSEQGLMSSPNFGATSLIEVKRKLSELGLSLKA